MSASVSNPASECHDDGPTPWLTCYVVHHRQLVAHARHVLGARADESEDVLQDVVHRFHRHPPRLRDRGAVHAYLRVAVRHGAITRLGRNREVPTGPDVVAAAVRPDPGFEDAVDTELVLGPALADLSPRQRQVIALVDLGHLPVAVAATRLGISVGSVKKHRFVGLRRLRDDPVVAGLRDTARSVECPTPSGRRSRKETR
ncbi:RNA polymerase sigma factor [Actinomycetospora termitidis]|uniref:Sigma-70 family RNA polymerase sigma factor n=1 Tax=Actinomycetospora termitidis TaxID=3053470 RepID=A0ABT7ME17_9PSEU|nr:sigma-70 family RNA polymerase sigma factor [Actinomycetospora sp. Odt1-22]MDL5158913.1 sigma-70 family RNA polymerase sigma factor [Actinomycetospora sp. Odt1-22]